MSVDQEAHLEQILDDTKRLMSEKYRAGQAEHGGNLFDLSPERLLDEAILEAIDQVVYLLTLKQKLSGHSTR